MPPAKPLVSAIKSAVLRVRSLEQARQFYEGVLGLRVLSTSAGLTDKTRRLWGLQERQVRCLRLGQPGDRFGLLDLVEIAGQPDEPPCAARRPWDYGWLTLELKTNHLDRAVETLQAHGAQIVSPPHDYEMAGQPVRAVMAHLASGERLTLSQVGAVDPAAPLFDEALAALGAVVPSLADALVFYRAALGLALAVALDPPGEPLAKLLGAPAGTCVQQALLTSGGSWTGKYELLQMTLPAGAPPPLAENGRAACPRLGLWMASVMAPDLDLVQAACRYAGVSVLRGPATIDRPCFGRVKAMIVRAPGGELLECMSAATGPLMGR